MKKVIILCLLFISTNGFAKISGYVAYGQNYSDISAIRLGIGDWEIGQINSYSTGAIKIFKLPGRYYAAFGFGTAPYTPGIATIMGVGFNYGLISNFSLRGELFGLVTSASATAGSGLLGISWNY